MPTTLLSIAGVSGNYPMIGFDLTQDVNPNRAFMQFDQTQALMKGNHDVVIQTPNSKAKGYVYDKEKDTDVYKRQVEILHNISANHRCNKRRNHKDKRDGGHDSRELILAK